MFIISYVILFATHLKWACNYLLQHSFSNRTQHEMLGICTEELSTGGYKSNLLESEEEMECAVCLCKIEEDEEIRELRCDHIFHRDCLDRWVGYKHVTCPLCRSSVFPHSTISDELGVEVLFFKYCSFSSGDRDRWWLR
ncbi:putative E3 ubiquitin-protein ligase RHA2B [Morella rubra]|uniref:Putative E3 ubiquitin-protein ligase RHA2B n=1 Tax=Morella rubra TaxID=262757 RepID=A0A6A1V1E9_9ROSI|nr:putative E3 ubiquitin-protein ligase RHA2B [Morella rubra]